MLKKYPFVKQNGMKDCASASLSMIIQYYDGFVSLDNLSMMLKTDRFGTDAYHLLEVGKQLGFVAKGIRMNLEDFKQRDIIFPCIAHVTLNQTYQHYIVIYEIHFRKKYLVIADPQDKIKKISFEDFEAMWNHVVFLFYPERPILKEREVSILSFCGRIVSIYRRDFIELFLSSILMTLFSIVSSFYLKYMLDSLEYQKNYITFLFFLFVILYGFQMIVSFVRMKILLYLNQKIDMNLTNESFLNIILLPYHYYHNRTTGEIVSRMQDLNEVRDMIGKVFALVFIDLPLSFIALIFLFLLNKTLCLLAIVLLLFYLLLFFIYHNKIDRQMKVCMQQKANTESFMIEAISGFETLKGIHLENHMITQFQKKYSMFLHHTFHFHNILIHQEFLKDSVTRIGQMVLILFGCFFVIEKEMTIGVLLTFSSLMDFIFTPMQNLLGVDSVIKQARHSLKRMLEMFSGEKQEIKLLEQAIDDIQIKNLSFQLHGQDILKDISCTFRKGSKVLLLGESGSGKSTLFNLLMQHYECPRGCILMGQYDWNDIDVSKRIFSISQNESLFTDTLEHNLLLDSTDKEKMIQVANMCEIEEFVDKNLGYHMLIEENGFNISGGQKQRIILARTLLKPFDILLIDEGLNQMDVDLERRILKRIFHVFKDKTIIVVSHRHENIDLYQQVIELSQGKIKKDVIKNDGLI